MIVSEKKKSVCGSKDVSEVLLSLLNLGQEHDREGILLGTRAQ